MKRHVVGALGILGLLGVLCVSVTFFQMHAERVYPERNCTPGPAQKNCNENYYEAYATEYGAAKAIALVTKDISGDPVLRNACHGVMHKIGHVAAKEYVSLGSAFNAGSDICANGFYHGVVEALFGEKELATLGKNDTAHICDASNIGTSSPVARINCVHGVGHALMYMSGGDISVSLLHCEDLANDADISQCATGAFMEEGFRIKRSTISDRTLPDPTFHCSQVAGNQQDCWLSQSGRTIKEKEGDNQAQVFCASLDTPLHREHCLSF